MTVTLPIVLQSPEGVHNIASSYPHWSLSDDRERGIAKHMWPKIVTDRFHLGWMLLTRGFLVIDEDAVLPFSFIRCTICQ